MPSTQELLRKQKMAASRIIANNNPEDFVEADPRGTIKDISKLK